MKKIKINKQVKNMCFVPVVPYVLKYSYDLSLMPHFPSFPYNTYPRDFSPRNIAIRTEAFERKQTH
jgi:hypothetical protein